MQGYTIIDKTILVPSTISTQGILMLRSLGYSIEFVGFPGGRMSNTENVKMIMEAIDNVKGRAKVAASKGNMAEYRQLMGDLLALENCLVTEIKKELRAA